MTRPGLNSSWLLLTLFALLNVGRAHAQQEFPSAAAVPGGVVILDLGPVASDPPEVFYNDHRVMVLERSARWRAIVGIPLATKPGKQLVRIERAGAAPHYKAFTRRH